MPSVEDILITLIGRDEASPVINNFASGAQSSLQGLESTASQGASNIQATYQSAFDQIGSGIHSLNSGMMSLSSLSRNLMGELGSTKSAMDWVYGTTSKEDTNKVLVQKMCEGAQDVEEAYQSLYNVVDKTTDGSLTSMQDLIPAMNAFKSATQATPQQLESFVTQDMADFGAFVLAQTGSTQLAQTAMMDLSKGIRNQFNALDQYGVSREALKNTGKWQVDPDYKGKDWQGDPKDIEGYMSAVREVIGDTSALMNTNEGLNAQMGKMWSRAGKRIGHEMMPGLKSLKTMFIELDNEMDGNLSTSVLRVALAIEEMQQKAYQLNTLYDGFRNLSSIVKGFGRWVGLMGTATEGATVAQKANNVSIKKNTDYLTANTLALQENMNMRMANADSLAYQSLMGDQGGALGGGMVGLTEGSDAGSMVGTDVLTTTAGGVLQSRYDKTKDWIKGDAKQLEDESESYQHIIDSRMEMNRKQRLLNSAFYESDEITDEIVRNTGISKERAGKALGDYISREQEDIIKLGRESDDFVRIMNDTDVANSIINSRRNFMAPFAKATDYVDDDLINDALNADAMDGIINTVDILNNNADNIGKTAFNPIDIPDSSNMFGDFNTRIASINTQTKKIDTEINGVKDLDGPFTRLKNKLNNFKTRLNEINWGDDFRKASERMGGKLQNGLKSLMDIPSKITDGIGKVPDKINNAFGKVTGKFKKIKSNGVAKNLDNVWGSLKGALGKGKGGADVVKDAGEGALAVKGAEKVMKDGEKLAQTASGAGVVGAEMAEAEAGLSFMALSEMGLAGAFTTLIVPTLAIAGVIAVLIPIIAGLAIEAMFFLKLVGQVMSAMHFEDINVEGVAESIQALATALAWIGVAMLSMSFVSLTTGLAFWMTGLGRVEGILNVAMDMLRKATTSLNQLASAGSVSPNVAENLKRLGEALNGVSSAMLSLTGVQLSAMIGNLLTGFGKFGTLADTLDKAKDDIQHAITAINSMEFEGIDESKVQQIKTTCDAIASFGDAFKGLSDIRGESAWGDFTSWLLSGGFFGDGGKSISQAFNDAHDDIVEASNALGQFNDLSDVDQGTVDRLKKVGDSIKALGDAFKGIREIRDNANWDSFIGDLAGGLFKGKYSITDAFNAVKGDIVNIANGLQGLSGQIPDIPEDLAKKLKTVTESLKSINDAITQLQTIKTSGGTKGENFGKFSEVVSLAKDSLVSISFELNQLGSEGGMQPIPDGLADNLKKVTSTLKNINDAITGLQGIQTASNGGTDFASFTSTIENARQGLSDVSLELSELGKDPNLQNISSDLADKLKTLATTLKGISDAIGALQGIKTQTNGNIDASGYSQLISSSREALTQVASELKSLQESEQLQSVDSGLSDKIKTVTNTLKQIQGAIGTLSEFSNANSGDNAIDPNAYQTLIRNAKDALVKVTGELKGLGDGIGEFDGEGLKTKIDSVTKAVKSLSSSTSSISSVPEVNSGDAQTKIKNAVDAIKKVSQELKNIGEKETVSETVVTTLDTVTKAVSSLSGVTGSLNAMQDVDPAGIENKVKNGVMGVQNASKQLKNIKESDKIPETIPSVIKSVGSAFSALKSAVMPMNNFPQVDGPNIGFKVGRAVTAVKRAGYQLKQIGEETRVGSNVPSIISSVRTAFSNLKSTVNPMNNFPQVDGHNIGYKIARAVTGVKRASAELKKLGEGDKVNNVQGILSNIRSAVSELKSTINGMSFNSEGQHIGNSIKTGLGTGLDGLSGIVSGKVTVAGNAGGSAGLALGALIARTVNNGFENSLRLTEIVQTAVQNAQASVGGGGGTAGATNTTTPSAPASNDSGGGSGFNIGGFQINLGERGRARTSKRMVESISTSGLSAISKGININRANGLEQMSRKSTMSDGKQNVNINIGAGAVQLDARNLTTKESRQVMINAIDGLNMVKGVKF